MTEKTKPVRKRVSSARPKPRSMPSVEQAEIAERAYYISLEEGRGDELDNWLRAERELTAI